MKVGIIGAMEQEVTILKQAITNCKTVNKAGCTFFSGQINDVEVVVLQSGIGKVAAAVGTTILLDEYQPDVVIKHRVCWRFRFKLKPWRCSYLYRSSSSRCRRNRFWL